MLKIDLLFYFFELQNIFNMNYTKEIRIHHELAIEKTHFSKISHNIFCSESSALFEPKKSSFFLGKTFQYHYCESKILENKFNLSRHFINSGILIGTFLQSTGSLILTQIFDRIFYLNRKQFFKFEIPRYLVKNTHLFSKTGLKSFSRNGIEIIILENLYLFNDIKSRINLGLLEKSCNIELGNLKECEIFYKKRKIFRSFLSHFFRNYNTIKLEMITEEDLICQCPLTDI